MQQVKLITATVVLTVLIWTIADQLVSDTVEVEATIRAQPTGGSDLIVRTDPPGRSIDVRCTAHTTSSKRSP